MQHGFRLTGLALSFLFTSSIAMAASLYSTTPKQSQAFFPVPQVLSPGDFSSKANTLNQQTKTRLAQEAADALPKKSGPAVAGGSPSSTAPSTNNTPVAEPETPPPPPPAQVNNAPQAMPFSSNPGRSNAPAAASPSDNSAYTGFGSGTKNNQPTQNTNSKSSGGWKIY